MIKGKGKIWQFGNFNQIQRKNYTWQFGNARLTNNHNQITIYGKLFFNDTIYDKRKSLTLIVSQII